MEEWRPVVGFAGEYEVSSLGRVRTLKRSFGVLVYTRRGRYLAVQLSKNDKRRGYYVHRLVASAFAERGQGDDRVNHKNGRKWDNRAENLEWTNAKKNTAHAILTGLFPDQKGSGNFASKLTEEDVRAIRAEYIPRKVSMYTLAKRYGVAPATICLAIQGKNWGHVS